MHMHNYYAKSMLPHHKKNSYAHNVKEVLECWILDSYF